MAGKGHARTPGAALHAWRIRAGFKHPGDLARCMLQKARRDPNSPLAQKFQGPNAETDLTDFITQYEVADELIRTPLLFHPHPHFLRVAAACIVGGIPSPIDLTKMMLELADGSASGDADQDRWEEGD